MLTIIYNERVNKYPTDPIVLEKIIPKPRMQLFRERKTESMIENAETI